MPATSQRLFFALVPDSLTCRKIEHIQRQQNIEPGSGGRAVKATQYHVTLAFLGNQPIDQLPRLLNIASGLHMPACKVQLDRLGSFRRAGVIWLGATSLPSGLRAFQARLIAGLEQAHIAFDRKPWQFHLTLYRDLRMALVKIEPDTVNWDLDGFSLVESISVERGVEYRQLGRWKAGPAGIEQQGV